MYKFIALNYVTKKLNFKLQCDLAEPCDPRVHCTNLNPGFRCGPCPPGFTGSNGMEGVGLEIAHRNKQRCHDINECQDGRNGGCAHHSVCINTEVLHHSCLLYTSRCV